MPSKLTPLPANFPIKRMPACESQAKSVYHLLCEEEQALEQGFEGRVDRLNVLQDAYLEKEQRELVALLGG